MFQLFGIKIANLSLSETIVRLAELIASGSQHLLVTANPEIMLEVRRSLAYKQVISQASLVLADGVGLVIASYLLGKPIIKGRVTGVDLTEAIIKNSGLRGYSVFLAGSTAEVLNKTTQYFRSKYSNINIVGAYSGVENKVSHASTVASESEMLMEKVKAAKPDVLLLAFGHPKQEMWLANHLTHLPVKVGIGVGGTFDFLSGQVPRAPLWLRALGLEWLFRLVVEPRRWRRIWQAVIVFPTFILIEAWYKLFHMEQPRK